MADEELLKQDERKTKQGKPKVEANDGKWTPRTEYFEADRDRSASLRLFISCQQTRRQRLNEIRAADNQNTAI